MPSPMSMHIPSIAMKSTILLAVILRSINIPSLLRISVPTEGLACTAFVTESAFFEGRMPMFVCLQSREYRANVPPAISVASRLVNSHEVYHAY